MLIIVRHNCRILRNRLFGIGNCNFGTSNIFSNDSERKFLNDVEIRNNFINHFQRITAHVHRRAVDPKQHRTAAILIPLHVNLQNNDLSLLYTVRSSKLNKHRREICFPGFDSIK